MDQFKVQAALSNMVAPMPSSVNSGEHDGQQQPQQQLSSAGAAAAAAAAAANEQSQQGGGGIGNEQQKDIDSLLSNSGVNKDGRPGPGDTGGASNQHHPVAEFLYQLTKMLTDDNSEIIEWVDGRIKVHHPERLEAEVLHKYFRHSKFASFQRQLNYFGFRKIAGKGKMSPCSYVNESATSDIRSLLVIKRKTNGSAARKAMAQRAMSLQAGMNPALGTGIPGLTGAPGGLGGLAGVGASGLTALGQLQMQQQLGMFNDNNAISQLLAQNQKQQQQQPQQPQSWNDLQQLGGGLKPNMPSIEQLQAQLTALQQNQGGASAALNAAAFNLASGGAAGSLNLSQLQGASGGAENPATAALNATSAFGGMPATAAMGAATAAAQSSNSLFDSATNLKALIGNDNAAGGDSQAAAQQNLLNRFPSATGMASNASLGNLLASSNRLSSLLSLNSFLSREPSLADLAMLPNGAQLAALGVGAQPNSQDIAKRFNQGSL